MFTIKFFTTTFLCSPTNVLHWFFAFRTLWIHVFNKAFAVTSSLMLAFPSQMLMIRMIASLTDIIGVWHLSIFLSVGDIPQPENPLHVVKELLGD